MALAALVAVAGLGVWRAKRVPQRPAVELVDGGGRVALSPQGELVGLASLPPQWRRDVAAALRTGRLDRPGAIADLAGAGPALRGPAATAPFSLLSPIATAVAGGRPVFRWMPLSGARSYEARVFDPDLHPVAASGPLTGTEWTPGQPLPPGTVYAWQVVAHRGNEDMIAPGPQSPPALFRVLAADQAQAVASAAREAGGSPLASACSTRAPAWRTTPSASWRGWWRRTPARPRPAICSRASAPGGPPRLSRRRPSARTDAEARFHPPGAPLLRRFNIG